MCSEAEICLSIVEAVAIDMVDEHVFRSLKYSAVHRKVSFSDAIYSCPTSGVESPAVRIGVPVVFGEVIVIIWVYDGVLSPCKGYAAICISITEEPV